MSLIDQIQNFVHRPKYTTYLEDPLFRKLVKDETRRLRTEDANDQRRQDARADTLGSLNTGGKGGQMKGTESGRFWPDGPEPLEILEEKT